MIRKLKPLGLRCMVSLLFVSFSIAAARNDLAEAAKQGNQEGVRLMLKQHVDVNTPLADGSTALAWAVYRDDLGMAKLLIDAGAKVNAANDYGVNPLSLACANGSGTMVAMLLKAGADPNAAIWTGETALMKCARTGNLEAVKLLLAHRANVNAKERREGQTALMWAAAARHPEIVQALIERGAEVNAGAKSGFTPLMFAAQQDDLPSVRTLLTGGANVNAATSAESVWPGDTALLLASASGHESLALFLLDHGADPNAADENGFTALHFALMQGLGQITGIRIANMRASWPTYLLRPNMPELVKALLAHGANPNPRVSKNGGSKLLYVNPIDPETESVSPVGATPFLLAALTRDPAIMRMLLAAGADPFLATEENVTPLMMASGLTRHRGSLPEPLTDEEEERALEAVKLLVGLGADVNAVESRTGMSALHGAAFNGSNKIIRFLAEKGAHLDLKDKAGQTALHKAANVKPKGAVERILVSKVVWKDTVDLLPKLGATPLNTTIAQGSDQTQ